MDFLSLPAKTNNAESTNRERITRTRTRITAPGVGRDHHTPGCRGSHHGRLLRPADYAAIDRNGQFFVHQGRCLKTPARTNAASVKAANPTQVSSETRFGLLTTVACCAELIACYLRSEIGKSRSSAAGPTSCAATLSRHCSQFRAATRPTSRSDGAGSWSPSDSAARFVKRTCCPARVACDTITQGESAAMPFSIRRAATWP